MAGLLQPTSWKPWVVFLSLAILSFGLFYGPSLSQWTQALPGSSEDAVKNYYTLAYHVQHGDRVSWFDGMNYPDGEHVVFTDNQPLIAALLMLLNNLLPIEGALPWLFPVMLLASFVVGGWFLFLVLNRNARGRHTWYHAALAIGIMLLAPQWQRLTGHFALAHGWVIPCFLYVLHQYSIGAKPAWLVGLVLLLSGYIHPYFLVMGVAFTGTYLLLWMLVQRQLGSWNRWRTLLLSTVAPLILYQFVLAMTDHVADRPPSPYGFTTYIATIRSLILPPASYLPSSLEALAQRVGPQANEGSYYLGFMAMLVLLVSVAGFVKRGSKRRWTTHRVMAWAALPVMLLALGLPFSLEGNEDLLRYVGPLRQFRGIGRFAFVGFFGLNLYAAIWLRRRLYLRGKWAKIAWAALALLWVEAYLYRNHIVEITSSGSRSFHAVSRPDFPTSAFSAILPLPYYHTGSENFRTLDASSILAPSMALSQATGIPLLSVHMSRTSLSQTLDHLALVTHTMELPAISSHHPDEVWLLIVDPRADLPAYQLQLVSRSTKVGEWEGYDLYRMRSDVYPDILHANIDAANYLSVGAHSLGSPSDTLPETAVYYDPCDDTLAFDRKVRHARRADWTRIIPASTVLHDTLLHELTFWMHAAQQGAMNTPIWFWEKDGDQDIQFRLTEAGDHVIGLKDDWALVRLYLRATEPGHSFDVILHRDGENIDLWLDDILLRPLGHNVVMGQRLPNINNRFYQPIDSLGVSIE